jgi:hypothetical protein
MKNITKRLAVALASLGGILALSTSAIAQLSIGTLLVDDERPYTYVDQYGYLSMAWWNGSEYRWDNLGSPPAGMQRALGVVSVGGTDPYAFVLGGDGHVWMNWWSGSGWPWTDMGKPEGNVVLLGPNSTNPEGMGSSVVAVHSAARPFVFVLGRDEARGVTDVWVLWTENRQSWYWSNLGSPPGLEPYEIMSSVVLDGYRPYVSVNVLEHGRSWPYLLWYDGHGNWGWYNPNPWKLVELADLHGVGAIAVAGNGRPQFYYYKDQGLLELEWTAEGYWAWSALGNPPISAVTYPYGVPISGLHAAVGAVAVDGSRPYVFMIGNDNRLWLRYWTTHWEDWHRVFPMTWGDMHESGRNGSASCELKDSLGVVALRSASLPRAYVRCEDGAVWAYKMNATGVWNWLYLGLPTPTSTRATNQSL